MKQLLLIATGALLALGACKKKDTVELPDTKLQINLLHEVNGKPLLFDSLIYQNQTGELYSISKMVYFLSDIAFYKNNARVFAIDTIAYIDAKNGVYSFTSTGMSPYSYDSISYIIGVPAPYNEHGKIAATYENVAMEWPDMMGGGYHFLKLEGHWKDTGEMPGYTVHLGNNPFLVRGGYKIAGQIKANTDNTLVFKMDVNEWLRKPNTYSFRTDGVYTMGNAALMQKVSENGRDVIKITP